MPDEWRGREEPSPCGSVEAKWVPSSSVPWPESTRQICACNILSLLYTVYIYIVYMIIYEYLILFDHICTMHNAQYIQVSDRIPSVPISCRQM